MVVPLIILIAVAVIDVNALTYTRQSAKIACYEGCRVGIVAGATSENVQAQVQEILDSRRVKDYVVQITPSEVSSMNRGDVLTVEVQLASRSNVYFGDWFNSNTMRCSVSMRCEK